MGQDSGELVLEVRVRGRCVKLDGERRDGCEGVFRVLRWDEQWCRHDWITLVSEWGKSKDGNRICCLLDIYLILASIDCFVRHRVTCPLSQIPDSSRTSMGGVLLEKNPLMLPAGSHLGIHALV